MKNLTKLVIKIEWISKFLFFIKTQKTMKTLLKRIGLSGLNWKQILLVIWLMVSIAALLSCNYDESPAYALPALAANVIITLILVKLNIPDDFWDDKQK
jgi:hypothetical protein